MGNVFSLDSLREELEKQYAPTQLDIGTEVITLRNIVRMPKKDRIKVQDLLEELGEIQKNEDHTEDQVTEAVQNVLVATAETVAKGQKLLKAIGDDVPLLMQVFDRWCAGEDLGEASDSPS
jgi:hypothetical protein